MAETWRLIDTGLASPGRNIALNRALLEARHADEISSTLRFGRSTRCVLLGCADSAEHVVDKGYCRAHDIPIQRRITNSAAAYFDERQLLWELYLHRRDVGNADLRAVLRRICHAAATAFSALGVDARYRVPGEIEVDGRTIATAACAVDGAAILIQATLLMDLDATNALKTLRVPGERLGPNAIAAIHERTVGLKGILGRQPDSRTVKHNLAEAFESEFDVEFREADLSLSEDARYRVALRQIETIDWISLVARPASEMPLLEAVHELQGGSLRVLVAYDVKAQTIRRVWLSGDRLVGCRRAILDLEAALRDVPVGRLAHRIERFFATRPLDMRMPAATDFLTLVRRALQQPVLARNS